MAEDMVVNLFYRFRDGSAQHVCERDGRNSTRKSDAYECTVDDARPAWRICVHN